MSSLNKSRCWRCEYILCEPGQTCDRCKHFDKSKNLCKCIVNDNDEYGTCKAFKERKRIVKNYIKAINPRKKLSRNYIKSIYIQNKM